MQEKGASSVLTAPISHVNLDERGVAYVTGTSIKVAIIVIDSVTWGLSPQQIQENYPALSLAEIHAALAYYYDNKEFIDAQISRTNEEYEKIRAEFPNSLTREQLRERSISRDRRGLCDNGEDPVPRHLVMA
jgi:uncharacterized protein (DUF433 family)